MTAHEGRPAGDPARGGVGPDPWLLRHVTVLRQSLAWAGWQMPESTAAWIIQDRLERAATTSGLPVDVVRGLMTPEHVREIAGTIADTLARERATGRGDRSAVRIDGPLGDSFRATG